MYYIPFWTFYALLHRDGSVPFVFKATDGRRFAIVDHRLYIGPSNPRPSYIISSRDHDKDNPSICLGSIGSGPSFGGRLQQTTCMEVNGMEIVFGIRYPFKCNDCQWLSAESGSGAYDVNDDEIPEYSCDMGCFAPYADEGIPDFPCCRYFFPTDHLLNDGWNYCKLVCGSKKYDRLAEEHYELSYALCMLMCGEWIRCRDWRPS